MTETVSDTHISHRPEHPSRRLYVREFSVKDELILVLPKGPADILNDGANNRAVTLNRSGRAIWELCDGSHSAEDIVCILEAEYPVKREVLSRQVNQALMGMSRLGFIDSLRKIPATGTGTTIVIGIEDKPYFWWQTAIFLESFSDKLPADGQTMVVVCNSGEPMSAELRNILANYETEFAEGTNHAKTHRLDIGHDGGQFYAALNRVEALSVAAEHVDDDAMICLLDSDIFLYGDLNIEIIPTRCAAPRNWHIEKDLFFSTVKKNKGKGIDLQKILEAMGCDKKYEPGGVNIFVTAQVAKNKKYIADCFRFAHALYLLGRTAGVEVVWMAEMPCFTLAMTANGIAYDLLERKELLVSDSSEESISDGTFYHYYGDPADGPHGGFRDSKWHKQVYHNEDFFRSDFEQFAANASTDHERYFFQLAEKARERLDV